MCNNLSHFEAACNGITFPAAHNSSSASFAILSMYGLLCYLPPRRVPKKGGGFGRRPNLGRRALSGSTSKKEHCLPITTCSRDRGLHVHALELTVSLNGNGTCKSTDKLEDENKTN